jgi:hypothetical protein
MYTVARFIGSPTKRGELQQVGQLLNVVFSRPIYDGLDRGSANRFSCTVCTSDVWPEHLGAINSFIDSAKEPISVAKGMGLDVLFDVAVYASDQEDLFVELHLDSATMQKLVLAGIEFVATVYADRSDEDVPEKS